ncbi:MAG TPA: translation initiation factor IF-3 [Candidatus Absconditabacterales bacterium]|nr:translation initiation factor IF-3 [Candidatus Absconditabacterales bacterium]HOQ79127.1 translation initiation factor IF-3 [Candidatus Absconditabacterales bacterium]HPK28218.1 translation initiation factor IF-3 [Candidatus Absconditabacterales bacterium]
MQERPFEHKGERIVYVNSSIKAGTIVIVDEKKNNLGSFPRRVALEMAEQKGLDLVQIHYDPVKQVCTALLTDYGKYMYRKQKDEREKKKTQKQKVLKELKINYSIGNNDLELKIKKGREFLLEGNNVKFSIRLKGRERMYESKAVDMLNQIVEKLSDAGKTQYSTPKKEAQGYSIILFSKF